MKKRTLLMSVALLLGSSLITLPTASAGGGFVVVVNKSNEVSQLSKSELKKAITGGTKQWKNGAAIQVDMSPKELLSRIQEQVFKGEMRRPVVLRSSAECIAFARGNPGAICVCSAAAPIPPEAHAVTVR